MPTVSVIVPAYKVEKYLNTCINSILTQTYADFELILIDDGSADNCGSICDEYLKTDERITVIHKTNSGVSSSRNIGIDYSSGEYICFFDSDDYLEKDFLEVMYNGIAGTNSDLVSCGYKEVYENGIIKTTYAEKNNVVELTDREKRIKAVFDVLQGSPTWCVWRRIYNLSIIKNNDILFCETSENYAEDLTFYLEYLLNCKSVSFIDYLGYNYVQRGDSMIHNCKGIYKLNALNENSGFFSKYFLSDNFREYAHLFPVLHFLMMDTEYKRIQCAGKLDSFSEELSFIQNKKYFKRWTKKLLFINSDLKHYFSGSQIHRMKSISAYCIHKNYKLFCILDNIYYKFFYKK